MKKKKRIALFGGGVVGQGLWTLLQEQNQLPYEIIVVVVKDTSKPRDIPRELLSNQAQDVWERNDVDIVVEAISDPEAALEIARKSLKAGIPFVSASKKMIAEHLGELSALTEAHGTPFRCEAAVCAELPVLAGVLAEPRDSISSIIGVLNGTSNYILTQMTNRSLTYSAALKEAQAAGFAEADPYSDVSGLDATYKSVILSHLAFRQFVLPSDALTIGIEAISGEDIAQANVQGMKIRSVAKILRGALSPQIVVMPTYVRSTSTLFDIDNEVNAVVITSTTGIDRSYIGRGAGGQATALGILEDLHALSLRDESTLARPDRSKYSDRTSDKETVIEVSIKGPTPLIKEILTLLELSHLDIVGSVSEVRGSLSFERLSHLAPRLISDGARIIQTGIWQQEAEPIEESARYSIH